MRDTVLNKLIDDFNELPFEDREYALELIQKQLVEAKRNAIFRRAKEAESNLKKGRVKKGSMQELMRDIESNSGSFST
jgi:hypothetical protein